MSRMTALSLIVLLAGVASAQEFSIQSLNDKIKSSKGGWTAGETSVSKLSDEEVQARLLDPADSSQSVKEAPALGRMPLTLDKSGIGPALDWRKKGIETPVRDQG